MQVHEPICTALTLSFVSDSLNLCEQQQTLCDMNILRLVNEM